MMRLAMVFLLVSLGAPRGATAQLPSVTLPQELDRVLRDYEREWKAGSASGLVALFVEDGFVLQPGRPPVRGHAGLYATDSLESPIGEVTSGGFGPTLNGPLAMGYVDAGHAAVGAQVQLMVRGKALPARVAAMPFVPNRYHRKG